MRNRPIPRCPRELPAGGKPARSRPGPWATLLLAALLSGCATSAAHKAYQQELQAREVNPAIQEKAKRFKALEILEIDSLLRQGVAEESILYHLRKSRASYHLTTAGIDQLRDAGASDALINYLLSTPYVNRPAYPPPPYFYDPYYYWRFPSLYPTPYYYPPPYHHGLRYVPLSPAPAPAPAPRPPPPRR